ncbi:hypothetical protein OG243_27925 [Streptomyces sp. NBC_01318]|uniref:hypothetical protein n=1 Tax=unclassified Streptomyces TaxID=2593676 RepID=UPI002DDA84A5|nr:MULTISPECIES: hypothetical protein [unclassified Streptomyces]WSC55640.1 hypothetical protein OG808_27195 [Streptomyces sp. NBC_01761]WSJ53044.1 hypothetical protein OG243_27925 [Streptomyces sp. NBC_01318]
MNRLTASVSAAVVATGASLALLAPAAVGAAAPNILEQVRAVHLGPNGPWFRLEDDPGNVNIPPGTEEVSPFADPVRFNGSLHLAIGPGQKSQAAHPFPQLTPLSTIASSELSYDTFVRSSTSTNPPHAVGVGPNLQLPLLCQGVFTTLSFRPEDNTDAQGHPGVVPDTWQHFASSASSPWRTSQTVATFPAQSDNPLSDYVAACDAPGDGVFGVIANVGRLGAVNLALDTYVDNLTANGTVYDFGVDGLATGLVTLRNTTPGGDCRPGRACRSAGVDHGSATGTVTFTDPADGPEYHAVGVRLVVSDGRALDPRDLKVTANGKSVKLTAGPGRTLVGVVDPVPSVNLAPNGTFSTPITISSNRGQHSTREGNGDSLTLKAELLAQGYDPLQRTGVTAETTLHQ